MLRQITKAVRHQLLKIGWIRREYEAYQAEKAAQRQRQAEWRYHEGWAQQLRNNSNAIDATTDTDNNSDHAVLVDYDTRMMGQRPVMLVYVRPRPFGMGRK
jgi:hypothetical protein